jgi:hypothetical protein
MAFYQARRALGHNEIIISNSKTFNSNISVRISPWLRVRTLQMIKELLPLGIGGGYPILECIAFCDMTALTVNMLDRERH